MTLKKNKVKLAEKRPLEDKKDESASKKPKAKSEQRTPKIASKKSAMKIGQNCENITIRPSTPESNCLNGDKSVPKGWKISSHKEEDGRSWVICPQVRKIPKSIDQSQ